MAAWKTDAHLEDHYGRHRGEIRARSIREYDASAQETIIIGARFTYRDRRTNEQRIGYFDRESSRFTATTLEGDIVTHYLTDEDLISRLPHSTYRD